MKIIKKAAFFAVAISLSVNSYAQQKKESVKKEVKEVADTVGNKTAEIAAKGVARATDKVYNEKVGPQGQTIYIDKHSKYFYINKKGHRVFLTEDKLKDKVEE